MLQSLHCLSGLSLDSLQYAPVSLTLWSPALDTAPQLCLTRAEKRRKTTSFGLLSTLLLMQLRRLLTLFATRSHGWLMVNLESIFQSSETSPDHHNPSETTRRGLTVRSRPLSHMPPWCCAGCCPPLRDADPCPHPPPAGNCPLAPAVPDLQSSVLPWEVGWLSWVSGCWGPARRGHRSRLPLWTPASCPGVGAPQEAWSSLRAGRLRHGLSPEHRGHLWALLSGTSCPGSTFT